MQASMQAGMDWGFVIADAAVCGQKRIAGTANIFSRLGIADE
jgi:hypothetical protein